VGFFRLILLAALIWFAWRLLSRALRGPHKRPTPGGKDQDYLPLTRCTRCGAHIPQPVGTPAICERCRSR
jgi:hypothetical protein